MTDATRLDLSGLTPRMLLQQLTQLHLNPSLHLLTSCSTARCSLPLGIHAVHAYLGQQVSALLLDTRSLSLASTIGISIPHVIDLHSVHNASTRIQKQQSSEQRPKEVSK